MSNIQLKPCVCGQKPQIRYKKHRISGLQTMSLFYVECNFCGKQNKHGAQFCHKENAINDWNNNIGEK